MDARPMLAIALLPSLSCACVLGAETRPGCRVDHPDDCGPGWTCSAGVCVRPTTPSSSPDAASDTAHDVLDDTGDTKAGELADADDPA